MKYNYENYQRKYFRVGIEKGRTVIKALKKTLRSRFKQLIYKSVNNDDDDNNSSSVK